MTGVIGIDDICLFQLNLWIASICIQFLARHTAWRTMLWWWVCVCVELVCQFSFSFCSVCSKWTLRTDDSPKNNESARNCRCMCFLSSSYTRFAGFSFSIRIDFEINCNLFTAIHSRTLRSSHFFRIRKYEAQSADCTNIEWRKCKM